MSYACRPLKPLNIRVVIGERGKVTVICVPYLIGLIFVMYVLAIVIPIFLRKHERIFHRTSMVLSALGSLLGIILSVFVLKNSHALQATFDTSLYFISLNFKLDSLSAFYILAISLISFAVSIYSIGYMKEYYGRKSIKNFCVLYNFFIATMISVVLADDVFSFLVFWELMSIASYFLVIYDDHVQENIKSGFIYFVMTHVGTALIVISFRLLYKASGSYSFESFSGITLDNQIKNFVFATSLIGFGIKAGMMPLHIWSPRAYPAAPSNISALMSGFMSKLGLYGIIRFVFDFLGAGNYWWGIIILVMGTTTAFLGVLRAYMENDIKRLIAFSSIENIGIILMGIGLSALGLYFGNAHLANLAITAALFHILNHALFKSLLFMGAGVVVQSCHTRDMEKYGGLIKNMPFTALLFLIGSISISALPPFNGFASEWLLYQSFFGGLGLNSNGGRIVLLICVAALGMTSALALGCFVKAFGMSFLAKPRSGYSENAKEGSPIMLIPMGILAAICMLFGLFPVGPLSLISPASARLVDGQGIKIENAVSPLNIETVSISPGAVGAMVIIVIALTLGFISLLSNKKKRLYNTWDCGFEYLNERMEYTATGFSESLRYVFSFLLDPKREVVKSGSGDYFVNTIQHRVHIRRTFENLIYKPLRDIIIHLAVKLEHIQKGSVNVYLVYIFIIVIGLLIYIR